MSQAIGSQGRLIVQEEDVTYKTDPSPAGAEKIPFVSESLRLSRELISSDIITGTRNPVQPVEGNTDVAGDITTTLQAYSDILFYMALGKAVSIGSDPYTHTITIDNTAGVTLPSFMIEKGFTDITQYFKYNGCKVNSLSLSVTPEGFQELTLSIIGAKETVNTSSFQANPSIDLTHTPFSGFVGSILEGSPSPSSLGSVLSVDLTVENNLDNSVYVIGGSGERASLPEGITKVSGTATVLFENTTLYNKAIGQSSEAESGLQLKFTKGDGLGSAGNEYCEIYVPELYFTPNAPVIEGPTGISLELPFEGFYANSSESTSMQVVFKNSRDRATDYGATWGS